MVRINFNGKMFDTETDLSQLVEKVVEYVNDLPTKECNHGCEVEWYEFDDLKSKVKELEERIKALEGKK